VCGIDKGTLRIAVPEGAVARNVTAEAIVKNWRIWRQRLEGVNIGGKRTVLHVDQVDRILGLVSVGRDDDGN